MVNYKFTKFPFMWPMTQNLYELAEDDSSRSTPLDTPYMYDASWNKK